jgi:tRNA (guanine-N(7)-)-methyltransferase subunit TRM82
MYADLSLYPRWPGLEEDDDLAGPAPTDADADAENTGSGAGKAGKQARKADGTADGNDDTQIKIKKDYTREELEAMGVKQLGRLKAHGVDVADLLLIRKKNAKARGKEAKRRKLEEANANANANAEGGGEGEGESKGETKIVDKVQSSQVEEGKGGEEDMIANA